VANDATLKIGADTRDAERALGNLQRSLQALAVGFATKELVALADAGTNLQNKLRSVTGSIEGAEKALAAVGRIATTTGTNIDAVGDLYQKIALQSQNLGLSQSEVARITENFSKALITTGTTGAAASSAIYQFAQALGRGKVAYEDIRQLQESSSATVALIARQFNLSGQDFVEAVQKGKISSQQLALAVNSLGPEVDKTFGGMNKTIGQSMENIRTNFILVLVEFEKSTGIFAGTAKLLEIVAKNMDKLSIAAAVFLTVFAAKKIYDIARAMSTLNDVVAKNKLLLIASLLASAGVAIYDLIKGSEEYKQATDEVVKSEEKLRGVKDAQVDLAKQQLKDLEEYLTKAQNQAKLNGLWGEELEIRRAIIDAANALKIPEEQLTQSIRNRVTAIAQEGIARRGLAETQQYLIALGQEISLLAVRDTKEQEIQKGLLDYKRRVGEQVFEQQRKNVEALLREKQVREEIRNLEKDLIDSYTKRVFAIDKLFIDLKKLRASETADRDAIYEQERRIYDVLNNLIPDALGKQAQLTSEHLARVADLNKAYFALTANINELENAREYLAAVEQQFILNQQKLEYDRHNLRMAQEDEYFQKIQMNYEMMFKAQGLNNDRAREYARERVAFEKKSEMEKAQFAIEQGASVFDSLGKYNRQAFEAAKAFNIANAIMNTYTGATKALAMYPPPFNFIAAAAVVAGGMAQIAQIRAQQYSGRALGGPVMAGESYIVGERGPELFTPATSGGITPNNQLSDMAAPVNINFNIQANDARGFDQLLAERKPMIINMIRTAMNDRGNKANL
jgi:tape measure domain-containing protein